MTVFIVLIAAELLILLAYWLQRKMAGKPEFRIRTCFDTWFSVIYCMFVFALYMKQLFDPASIADLGSGVQAVLASLPADIYLVYVFCLLIMHFFEKRIFANPEKQDNFASYAYIEQEDHLHQKRWVLRRRMLPYRQLADTLTSWLLGLTMIMEGITLYSDPYTSSLWFAAPVLALIILRTLSLYLGGPVEEKRAEEVQAVDVKSEEISNFAQAASHLQKTFPDALLYTAQSYSDKNSRSPERRLRELESSEDLNDHVLASDFRNKMHEQSVDPDYVELSTALARKKNVLIRNPFYEDLSLYLAPALMDSLMEKHKVLILTSGNESVKPVKEWVDGLLDSKAVFQEQWRIRELEDLVPEADVGILPYYRLYDPDVMLKNRALFEQTEMVLLLRPSQILTTMQIPLSVLSDMLRNGPVSPVFCILDLNMDRLKDTLSHVLKTPIHSDLTISDKAHSQTVMIWDAEADYQAIERFERQPRFLGGAVELSAEAVSAGVPDSLWVSETRIPVGDIQDTAAKSFRPICRVMKTEESQSELRNRITFSISPWQMEKKKSEFLVIEDEFNNPFAAAGLYSSRAENEVFLNILSGHYLLRDYFVSNPEVFASNPDAVPSLVPDFAKTRRNILLKLILQMMVSPMSEQEVIAELDLVDLHERDPYQALLKLTALYTFAGEDLFYVEKRKIHSNVSRPQTIRYFGIHPDKFDEYFSRTLKNTSYLLEDEISGRNILDSRLFSLILQTTLPGQYVNYGGKSYLVKSISPVNGVVLRRSSDLIDGRKFYRQIRHYVLPDFSERKPDYSINVNGFSFNRYGLDFDVDTLGYLEFNHWGDFSQRKVHEFHRDNESHNFRRSYRNKTVLEIRFPPLSAKQIYQIALILQEMLPSVMPTGYPYLSILAKRPDSFGPQYASIISEADHLDERALLIVEDSDMDLGLLDEFENYFFRLLEIVQDYLRWMSKTEPENENVSEDLPDAVLDPSSFASLEKMPVMDEDEQALLLIAKFRDLVEEIAIERMLAKDDQSGSEEYGS